MNEDDVDELSRSKATIHLKINDFSKLKKQKNFRIYSKQYVVRNFGWFIATKLDEDEIEKFGFFLHCRSIDYGDSNKSIGFPVKVNAKFSVLNRLNPSENLIQSLKYLYNDNNGYGYPSFIEIKKLIDPINGYYNLENDSIAVELAIQRKDNIFPKQLLYISFQTIF
ncbi:ubiquitin carboxyl-terminal hydrolase 7 isoform X3 [Brachionus plicatilis]|uniref:Ubiquitin carboxyl-terminal hydrolase 7 isoform X3 n=1 Tax=Brachionus plicatilis TaxID=10195 RepID=A0A3M7PWE8_BRAPC|nr:ubiquitin carboxyl-terminal hydrolase 7 isoform X3 [Brachionus plicatilis]